MTLDRCMDDTHFADSHFSPGFELALSLVLAASGAFVTPTPSIGPTWIKKYSFK